MISHSDQLGQLKPEKVAEKPLPASTLLLQAPRLFAGYRVLRHNHVPSEDTTS
jgi:hypothetical protein